MKFLLKLIILFNILVLIEQTKAQNYLPLAIENAQWIILQDDEATFPPDLYFGYKINGDTVINSKSYKKVYKREFEAIDGDYNEPYMITNEYLFGAVRDDITKGQVFAINFCSYIDAFCPCNEEYLMFDYTLQIGDTASDILCQVPSISLITDVYSWNIYNKNRKILEATFGGEIIEGVGSSNGLFEGIGYSVKGVTNNYLEIYCIGSDHYCLDGFLSTFFNNSKTGNTISVFPNPVSNSLHIQIKSFTLKNNILKIEIIDIVGKKIIEKYMNTFSKTIDVSNIEKGVYLFNLYRGNKLISIKKIIKL